jgi:hypothetical protein
MSELVTVPRIVIGNRQLCPDATLMSPVEFSPQFASSTSFEQSEAASAGDADIEPVAPTISVKAATLDNRMVELLVFKNAAYRLQPRRYRFLAQMLRTLSQAMMGMALRRSR